MTEKSVQWKDVDITLIPKEELVDIRTVRIDPFAEWEQRRQGYVAQIKNPYCFLCDDIPVKISFSDEAHTLQERLTRYFTARKRA